MSFLSVRGLIIRSVLYKESDRIISILTKDNGVVSARAPGAAKGTSPYSYSTQPMMLCDFVLARTRDYYYLRDAEIIEAFPVIQEDIELLTATAHLLEITADVCIDTESCKAIYPLLLHALYALTKKDKDYRLTVSIFEWKVPDLLGFSADMGSCSCGERNSSEYGAFSFSNCRLYCRKSSCLKKAGYYQLLSPGCVDALVYIYSEPVARLFSFAVSAKILEEMARITRQYLGDRLEKKYTRMDLLLDQPTWNPQNHQDHQS